MDDKRYTCIRDLVKIVLVFFKKNIIALYENAIKFLLSGISLQFSICIDLYMDGRFYCFDV